MKHMIQGALYSAWDVYQQGVIAQALANMADDPEDLDEYLRLLLMQWMPHLHKIHDPNRYGYN